MLAANGQESFQNTVSADYWVENTRSANANVAYSVKTPIPCFK